MRGGLLLACGVLLSAGGLAEDAEERTNPRPAQLGWYWSSEATDVEYTGVVYPKMPRQERAMCLVGQEDIRSMRPWAPEPGRKRSLIETTRQLLGDALFPESAGTLVEFYANDEMTRVVLRAAYRLENRIIALKGNAEHDDLVQMAVLVEGPLQGSLALLPASIKKPWVREHTDFRPRFEGRGRISAVAFLFRAEEPCDESLQKAEPSANAGVAVAASEKTDEPPEAVDTGAGAELPARERPAADEATGVVSSYLVLGLASVLAVAAAGAWLLLRRRLGG